MQKSTNDIFTRLCTFLISMLLPLSSWANTDAFEFFQEEARVVTASKKAEKIALAPGIMTVVTAEEIRKFGAHNVQDVLDRVTSVYSVSSPLYRYEQISLRGNLLTHTGNHTLLMINSRPVRSSRNGAFNSTYFASFPVQVIEHIEIIRGPGSVLYGSGAYDGVVNIIMKEGQENRELHAETGYGSFNTVTADLTAGQKRNDLSLYGGVHFLNSDGWDFSAVDELGRRDTDPWREENVSWAMNTKYKRLAVTTFLAKHSDKMLGALGRWPSDTLHSERAFVDVGYEHPLRGDWKANANVAHTYTNQNFRHDQFVQGHEKDASFDTRSELTVSGEAFQNANLIFGGVNEYQSRQNLSDLRGTFSIPEYSRSWWSSYIQADYTPWSFMKVVAGGQWNKPAGVKADLVPRAAVLFNFTPEWGAKFLYGQAFRSPYPLETLVDIPGTLVGTPNLRPEKVTTYDYHVFYHTSRWQMSATYFRSRQKDLIIRVPVPASTAQTFTNRSELSSQGLELESKASLFAQTYFTGSYTYQTNKDDLGREDITFMPRHMVKTGLSYEAPVGVTASVFNAFYSARHRVNMVSTTTRDVNAEARGFHALSAHLIFDVNRLCRLSMKPKMELKLLAQNLLEPGPLTDPEFNRKRINTIPTRPGRAFYGTVSLSF
jgi:outer membrane receptor for ferrienterochelin and colicins